MKYQIGQNIETKYGKGIVVAIGRFNQSLYVKVEEKGSYAIYVFSQKDPSGKFSCD